MPLNDLATALTAFCLFAERSCRRITKEISQTQVASPRTPVGPLSPEARWLAMTEPNWDVDAWGPDPPMANDPSCWVVGCEGPGGWIAPPMAIREPVESVIPTGICHAVRAATGLPACAIDARLRIFDDEDWHRSRV